MGDLFDGFLHLFQRLIRFRKGMGSSCVLVLDHKQCQRDQ